MLGKLEEGFCGIFPVSGRRRVFRDGGDGEADRPAGPWRARDSRHGGRPRRWEGVHGCWPGASGAGGIRGTSAGVRGRDSD
jgi:hypothetical protein